jgi:hypothetical protein
MEEMQKESNKGVGCSASSGGELTFFEQVTDIQVALAKEAGMVIDPRLEKNKREVPKWCGGIVDRLKKTILKPILKLRPNGVMNWRNYGRMMGIVERYKTFILHDVERDFIEAGLDKLTEEKWEKIWAAFGKDKLRKRLIEILERPVADDEPLEKLVDEVLERQFYAIEKMREDACRHIAQQDAKVSALFFKGMAEGYTCFLDEAGKFVGDRGRTRLYFDFLAYRLEIERFRQSPPEKSRRDLQQWVIAQTGIKITNDDEWFDHFCDEISLSMKGVGRALKAPVL